MPELASWRRVVVITPPAIWWRRNAASKSWGAPVGQLLPPRPVVQEVRSDEPEQPVVDVDACGRARAGSPPVRRASGSERAVAERPAADLQHVDTQCSAAVE